MENLITCETLILIHSKPTNFDSISSIFVDSTAINVLTSLVNPFWFNEFFLLDNSYLFDQNLLNSHFSPIQLRENFNELAISITLLFKSHLWIESIFSIVEPTIPHFPTINTSANDFKVAAFPAALLSCLCFSFGFKTPLTTISVVLESFFAVATAALFQASTSLFSFITDWFSRVCGTTDPVSCSKRYESAENASWKLPPILLMGGGGSKGGKWFSGWCDGSNAEVNLGEIKSDAENSELSPPRQLDAMGDAIFFKITAQTARNETNVSKEDAEELKVILKEELPKAVKSNLKPLLAVKDAIPFTTSAIVTGAAVNQLETRVFKTPVDKRIAGKAPMLGLFGGIAGGFTYNVTQQVSDGVGEGFTNTDRIMDERKKGRFKEKGADNLIKKKKRAN